MVFIPSLPSKPLEGTAQDADLKIVGYRWCLFKRGLCSPFGGVVAGDVSSDQDKDCVSYIREENELVLALVIFFLFLFFSF